MNDEAPGTLTPPRPLPAEERPAADGLPAKGDDLVARRDAERRRAARQRKRLMLWAIPFALVALLLAIKFLSMSIIASNTVSAYREGDYERALNSAQQQKIVNIVERWKAPYNTGTSYLQLGFNDEARAELESALPLANPIEQCVIRANLAIAIERQGDALLQAGDRDGAVALWREALAVLEQADPACGQSASKESQEESYQRIRSKIEPPSSSEEGPNPDPGTSDGQDEQTQQDLQQLEEQVQENQNDRQDQMEEETGGGQDGTDRPW